MIVLSLFDGISCAMVALRRSGIQVDNYFASEIDKYAINISKKNNNEIIHIGDIKKCSFENGVLKTENKDFKIPEIDLIIGGSPCQGFSFAGKQLNFKDERSALIFDFLRLLKEIKPKYFILENVLMNKDCKDFISKNLSVEPYLLNSNLVSAQDRKRLYWTNIILNDLPEDKNLFLKDVVIHGSGKALKKETASRLRTIKNIRNLDQKSSCIMATGYKLAQANGMVNVFDEITGLRCTTPLEWERLQTLPDNYTEGVSNTQRYKMLGNAMTVDIITFILNNIK